MHAIRRLLREVEVVENLGHAFFVFRKNLEVGFFDFLETASERLWAFFCWRRSLGRCRGFLGRGESERFLEVR